MSAILGSPTNPIEHGAPGTKIIRVLVVGPPAQLALFARKLTLALPVVDLMRRAKRGDSTTRDALNTTRLRRFAAYCSKPSLSR